MPWMKNYDDFLAEAGDVVRRARQRAMRWETPVVQTPDGRKSQTVVFVIVDDQRLASLVEAFVDRELGMKHRQGEAG
jgi:hypothetical protein